MYFSSLFLLTSVVLVRAQYTFNLDCSLYPEPCNNNCYAIYVSGKPTTLNWGLGSGYSPSSKRSAAGCASPQPCPCPGRVGHINAPYPGATSCDEYPYASSVEGGSGAIIRCTDYGQNTGEGTALIGFLSSNAGCGGVACTYNLVLTNTGANTPFCNGVRTNDGFEYTYLGAGNYIPAKRSDEQGDYEHLYELHQPNASDYLEPHMRREMLLENGQRALLLTRDMETSWDDQIFVFEKDGEYYRTGAVRELHGWEKSPAFRPSTVSPEL